MLRLVTLDLEAKVCKIMSCSIIAKKLISHNRHINKGENTFSSLRFAARPSSWVQLDLCLPGGRGQKHFFSTSSAHCRCSTTIGLPLPLYSPPASLTGFLTPRTGRYSNVSSVSRTRSINLQQQTTKCPMKFDLQTKHWMKSLLSYNDGMLRLHNNK